MAQRSSQENMFTSVPDEKNVPKTGKTPPHQPKINNLAGDKELTDKVWAWVKNQHSYQANQDQRKEEADKWDLADRMERVAQRRDSTSSQYDATLSDVASTMYFRQIRTITAGEALIFLKGDNMPAEYVAELNTDEYDSSLGRFIAEQWNGLFQHTYDEDKRKQKLADIFWRNNKYGQCMVSDEWVTIRDKRTRRVPVRWDERGVPVKYQFKEMEVAVYDGPSLIEHDLKDCYFDAQIEDMDLQMRLGVRKQVTYQSLLTEQANGYIMNVEKVGLNNLYTEEDDDENVLENRLTNAGEDTTTEPTGLYDCWHEWVMVPIDEGKKKNGKGKWAPEKVAPSRYWATFIGKMGGDAVCVRLIKNPYFHKRVPYKLIHSHKDDKGAYHDGYPQRLKTLYQQATTNINQSIDNVTMRNRAPWIADGPVHTRDLSFRSNKLVKVAKGTRLERWNVPDTTGVTMNMHDRIERDADQTTGADKPILGEPLGGRTSATEAKNIFDQATMPLDEKASYLEDQLFTWLLETDSALWEQYADPKRVVNVLRHSEIIDIKPAELWGPVKVKVTAVDRFRLNTVRRQEINSVIANVYRDAEKYMSTEGARQFWLDAFSMFGFEHTYEYFPANIDFDASARARDVIYKATVQTPPEFVEPRPEENHKAWLAELEPALAEYKSLPQDEFDPERARILEENIRIRQDFIKQEEGARQQSGGAQGLQQGLPGEIVGEQTAAIEGALPQ